MLGPSPRTMDVQSWFHWGRVRLSRLVTNAPAVMACSASPLLTCCLSPVPAFICLGPACKPDAWSPTDDHLSLTWWPHSYIYEGLQHGQIER